MLPAALLFFFLQPCAAAPVRLLVVDRFPCSTETIATTSTASYTTDYANGFIITPGSEGVVSQVAFWAFLDGNPPSAITAALWSDDETSTSTLRPKELLYSTTSALAVNATITVTSPGINGPVSQLLGTFSAPPFPAYTKLWLVVTPVLGLARQVSLCAVPIPPTGYTLEETGASFLGPYSFVYKTSGVSGFWSTPPVASASMISYAALGGGGAAPASATGSPTPAPTASASGSPTPSPSAPTGSPTTASPTATATGTASATASATPRNTTGGPPQDLGAAAPAPLSPGGAAVLSIFILLVAAVALLCLHRPSLRRAARAFAPLLPAGCRERVARHVGSVKFAATPGVEVVAINPWGGGFVTNPVGTPS